MRSRETEFCVCERERYFTTRVIARETYEGTQDISRERVCVCERHTREQWRNMRPWEIEFVFVCEKEILKRKSRRFSYLRSERHLCMRGVRVEHMGIVERNETPGDKVLCLCERKRFHMENHS